MAIKLLTDSTSYIDKDMQEELDIQIVNLSVNFPDESFDETTVPYDYYYDKIEKNKTIPTSSQPAPGQIYNAFKRIVSSGDEVLAIFLSSKMSGTYSSALSVKRQILKEYPQSRIEILDSMTNCMALGLQVIEAAKTAKTGTMEEVIKTAQYIKDHVRFYFVPASLEYLIKGGRIGGASALIGSLLQIRPILYVNEGMTDVRDRVRGNRSAIKRMLNLLQEDAKNFGLKHLFVHHINSYKTGQELADRLNQQYHIKVPSLPIGPVIGSHVGPAIGIVYCTEK